MRMPARPYHKIKSSGFRRLFPADDQFLPIGKRLNPVARSNGRNPSQPMQKQSVRSSKAMFSVIPAPLFSLPGLSVALCAAYSPFHCCCPLHFTIFWAFLSTDIQGKGEIL